MEFLAGLVGCYLLTWGISIFAFHDALAGKMPGIVALAIMFVSVGIAHFAMARKFEDAIPRNWPYKKAMNYISGLAEIAGGIGVLLPQFRTAAAYGLILLLLVIFPLNIAIARRKPEFKRIFRLFFQPIYIAWVWWFCLHVS
jgi:uncharacterized membrane protein